MGVSFQARNHLLRGCGTAPKCHVIMAGAPQRNVTEMTLSFVPLLGALSTGDGGGKRLRRLLGCSLEKRPP
jgi:hypothetical protein